MGRRVNEGRPSLDKMAGRPLAPPPSLPLSLLQTRWICVSRSIWLRPLDIVKERSLSLSLFPPLLLSLRSLSLSARGGRPSRPRPQASGAGRVWTPHLPRSSPVVRESPRPSR
eukprot:scaffold116115_cov19-Tisochrysis_lutea.AAC.1